MYIHYTFLSNTINGQLFDHLFSYLITLSGLRNNWYDHELCSIAIKFFTNLLIDVLRNFRKLKGMFKFLILVVIFYIIFRIVRRFITGIFVITKIPGQNQTDTQNPYINRASSREKDISDRARILDEDKNTEQNS